MKKNLSLYLLLLLLGYLLGTLVERWTQRPVHIPQVESAPAPPSREPQPRFFTVTEVRLHDLNEAMKSLQEKARHQKADPTLIADHARLSQEALEIARKSGTSGELLRQLGFRCWDFIARGELGAVQTLVEEAQHHAGRGDIAHFRRILSYHYRDFGYFSEAEDQLRLALTEEPDLAARYELRLLLSRVLVEARKDVEAEETLEALRGELERATQKYQIAGYLIEVWSLKEELAQNVGDQEAAAQARETRKRLRDDRRRLHR